ncbi:MAG: hypothetical protein P8P99_14870 [Maricaulis sp.]|jgi:hypothetical protein|nr:hypothetical protein [Maricaulis sp.]
MFRFIFLVTCLNLTTSCTTPISAPENDQTTLESCDPSFGTAVHVSDTQISICGIITLELREGLETIPLDGIDLVSIVSFGGDLLAANEIVARLNSFDVTIGFPGICASACMRIFAIANSTSIGEGALFIPHAGFVGKLHMIERTPEYIGRSANGFSDYPLTLMQSRRLEIVDIDSPPSSSDMMEFETVAVLRPICSGRLLNGNFFIGENSLFQAEFEIWFPLEDTLRRWSRNGGNLNLANYDQSLSRRQEPYRALIDNMDVAPTLEDEVVSTVGREFYHQTNFSLCDFNE